MNSNDIRNMIASAMREEEKTGQLRKHLSKFLPEDQIEEKLNFVKAYLLLVPIVLDGVFAAAQKNGLLASFQPIFDTVFTYWAAENDVIPDRFGLAGICDDAYLSLSAMQNLSEQTIPGTSSRLLQLDTKQANATMRLLIGEPYASQLDLGLAQTLGALSFQNMFSALLNNPALLNSVNAGTWGGGGAEIKRQMQEQMKKDMIKDSIRHDLAKNGIFM
jgi:hypothetical protein